MGTSPLDIPAELERARALTRGISTGHWEADGEVVYAGELRTPILRADRVMYYPDELSQKAMKHANVRIAAASRRTTFTLITALHELQQAQERCAMIYLIQGGEVTEHALEAIKGHFPLWLYESLVYEVGMNEYQPQLEYGKHYWVPVSPDSTDEGDGYAVLEWDAAIQVDDSDPTATQTMPLLGLEQARGTNATEAMNQEVP